jgi:hypothetical protein
MRTPLTLLLTAAVALSYAGAASAETVDSSTRAAARELGEEGMKLYDKGDCPGAVDRLTRAHELVHVPTLALYAGKCLEKLGRLVDASERYLDATRDPVDANAPPAQKAAQVDADRARKAILPRLAQLELVLEPPAPDAVVTLDGHPVPSALLGVRRPVDPGSHTIEVQRGGKVTSKSFSINEGQAERVQVQMTGPAGAGFEGPPGGPPPYGPPGTYPPGAYPPGPYAPPGAYPPGAYPFSRPPPPPPMQRRSTALFVTGIILIPLGTVVAIGGALDAAITRGSAAGGDALAILGLAGIGGGIAMTVIGGKKLPVEGPPPAVSFEPLIGPTSAGMRMRF